MYTTVQREISVGGVVRGRAKPIKDILNTTSHCTEVQAGARKPTVKSPSKSSSRVSSTRQQQSLAACRVSHHPQELTSRSALVDLVVAITFASRFLRWRTTSNPSPRFPLITRAFPGRGPSEPAAVAAGDAMLARQERRAEKLL